VLAGDGRLLERLRSEEFAPLGSRMRVRLALERAAPDELQELLLHCLQKARRRQADDAGTDRHARRSRLGQPACADDHRRRAARGRGAARGPPHRREAVPGDLRSACRRDQGSIGTAERKEEHRWLIAGLWSEQAVGIVGGEPKCCKSFLALDIAVAVAAGIPCLRRFAVPRAGRVLLYAAEDALHIVRRRFDGICDAAGVALADLDIQVITAPTLRLDLEADRNSLTDTVARLQPRLLILDPFVRLHASTRTPAARSRR